MAERKVISAQTASVSGTQSTGSGKVTRTSGSAGIQRAPARGGSGSDMPIGVTSDQKRRGRDAKDYEEDPQLLRDEVDQGDGQSEQDGAGVDDQEDKEPEVGSEEWCQEQTMRIEDDQDVITVLLSAGQSGFAKPEDFELVRDYAFQHFVDIQDRASDSARLIFGLMRCLENEVQTASTFRNWRQAAQQSGAGPLSSTAKVASKPQAQPQPGPRKPLGAPSSAILPAGTSPLNSNGNVLPGQSQKTGGTGSASSQSSQQNQSGSASAQPPAPK